MNRSLSPQKKTVRTRAAWLVFLLLAAGVFAYPAPYNWLSSQLKSRIGFGIGTVNAPFVLGLDLQGGTHLE
jgi:preprotein translocase subunit SecD